MSAQAQAFLDAYLEDPSTAVLSLNDRSLRFENEQAKRWLGVEDTAVQVPVDAFSDDGICKLINRQQNALSISDMLDAPLNEPYVGLVTEAQTRWVHWTTLNKTGESEATIVLKDVTDLVQQWQVAQGQANDAHIRDELTQLYNRRYGITRIEQLYHFAKRYDSGFSIALINLDHFRSINDTYGHPQGDDVLKRIAFVIRESIRETDLCARFGGEEFLVIMPETHIHAAMHSLNRLRQQVSELKWADMKRPVTVSTGVIEWQPLYSLEQLLFLAQERLLTAKSAGRNQVCGDLV